MARSANGAGRQSVHVLGSQDWPIRRGLPGCRAIRAKAASPAPVLVHAASAQRGKFVLSGVVEAAEHQQREHDHIEVRLLGWPPMSLASLLFARLLRLPSAHTRDVLVERDLRVPMPDGAVLLADRYAPRGGSRLPLVLLRSPYDRHNLWALFGRLFAERGYQALVQSTRGTFGSTGAFEPFQDEADDGLATLEWLVSQSWCGDRIGLFGPSYLGLAQWAVAKRAPAAVKALAVQISASQFHDSLYPGGAFSLDTALSWVYQVQHQEERPPRMLAVMMTSRRILAHAFAHLPLRETDRVAIGKSVDFYQTWLAHTAAEDEYWRSVNFSRDVPRVSRPVTLLGGWYDIFLPWQLADYGALRQAGQQPYLTIGPWTHVSFGREGPFTTGLRDALAWFDAHLRDNPSHLRRAPVRVFVMGRGGGWLDLADWPPPYHVTRWYVQQGRRLALSTPGDSEPDSYIYDPADPTPSVGGSVLGLHAGARDNRRLEARSDVLTFTSDFLDADMTIVGPVSAEVWFRSSLGNADVFARLCVVDTNGRSINLSDGLVRLEAHPHEVRSVTVVMWPTAYRFRRGQRVRLQVSSGAHPRYSRNTGSGEPLATATRVRVANQAVYHDPQHPSALLLPRYQP